MQEETSKSIIIGLSASVLMLLAYILILTVANSFSHAIEEFLLLWPWIIPLVIGFGIQIGLYSFIRSSLRERRLTAATTEVAATGGISTASMVACCAHHLTEVLVLFGLSAAALFLLKYQITFIILGIFSNIVGITIMLGIIQKNNLFSKELSGMLFKFDMKTARNAAIVLSAIIVSVAFLAPPPTSIPQNFPVNSNNQNASASQFNLGTKTNNENEVSVDVTPIDFSFGSEVRFNIGLNTHTGSLDYDLTKISVLQDDKGNSFNPIKWEGPPPGGHHRTGILTFPKLGEKTSSIKLVIKGIYDVPERVFVWQLM
ncbi:MAG: hypothetical protein AB1467_03000 [Candidatus Diapherotrites archaeon]